MSGRLHNFTQSYKGQSQFNQYIDYVSGALLFVGAMLWIFLAGTIGKFIPIAAHAIGFLFTLGVYLLYTVKVPSEYYNKMGNERLYKLLYSTWLHKKKRTIYTKTVRRDL